MPNEKLLSFRCSLRSRVSSPDESFAWVDASHRFVRWLLFLLPQSLCSLSSLFGSTRKSSPNRKQRTLDTLQNWNPIPSPDDCPWMRRRLHWLVVHTCTDCRTGKRIRRNWLLSHTFLPHKTRFSQTCHKFDHTRYESEKRTSILLPVVECCWCSGWLRWWPH